MTKVGQIRELLYWYDEQNVELSDSYKEKQDKAKASGEGAFSLTCWYIQEHNRIQNEFVHRLGDIEGIDLGEV